MLAVVCAAELRAQELGGAGTIPGTVVDPMGGVMQAVTVTLTNSVTGFKREATTDAVGKFMFRNVPPNTYQLRVEVQGFEPLVQEVSVRSGVPIDLKLSLNLAGATETVSVVGRAIHLAESDPVAHTDIDARLIEKLPIGASGGLNQVITMASPGVVADSNGFFHPVGDHAQTQFSIDNQPVTDQQSRVYSNQIAPGAVQSMEMITGVPPAEYGDKSSLVVHIVTKSGLDQAKPTGTLSLGYGSFRTPTADVNVGAGSHRVGDFLSLSGMRTDRYLDPPEFAALHDTGSNLSLFNRVDFHPTGNDSLHLNVQLARSSFDVPNTYETAAQTQHQNIDSINVAPGYSRIIGSDMLLTANGFFRNDRIGYLPSADPFADSPATVSQDRTLTNIGVKADLTYTSGRHNVKVGGSFYTTKLEERFTLGFTDPAFNSPCLDASRQPSALRTLNSPGQCRGGLVVNPDFSRDLLAFDLTRGGRPFVFNGAGTIKGQAAFVQDDIKAGNATFKAGVRFDHYDGQTQSTLVQPRLGVSYEVPRTRTVVRASYGRMLETPYNENLLLSSGVGANALVGQDRPLAAGRRHAVDLGVQQAFGGWVVLDVGYFNKRTTNAYDFNVLFNTPIVFPIAWDHSKVDGFTGRVNLVEHRGFSAFMVLARTNAIFSLPSTGGVLISEPAGDFRIDHDQKFNQTTNLQYVFHKPTGAWGAFVWRYDSGLVSSLITDVLDLLQLTADQQTAIGMTCGAVAATLTSRIASCPPSQIAATRMRVPAAGTFDLLDNPARVAPRHVFDVALGADNVFKSSRTQVQVRLNVLNVFNNDSLYNFLSTFTGTHFISPRAYHVQVGVKF